jgi:hypothetical protein
MNENRLRIESQQLIDALAHDMKFRAELEEAGLLYEGYNPQMRAIHEENAQLLEDFLAEYGWPYPSQYGKEVHEAAWMIAIHAISKPDLLRKVLQILEKALQAGEPVANEYTKLYDRIALYEGRQQVYGTQFSTSPTGWVAWNLYDPENVDKRRKALGLPSFLENKQECGAGEGGFATTTELEHYDADWDAFLNEVGWQK